MDTTEATSTLELFPGNDYPLCELVAQTVVVYDQQYWLIIGHGYDKSRELKVTELGNGAYYANRLTLPSTTPVTLV